jgi:MYXO-CTERM domain-containing protein
MTSASPTNDPTLSQLGLFAAPQGTSTISVNYGESVPITSTFMIGVTTEIVGETTGAVVLFTNNAFATANTGNDLNTIFFDLLNYSEWYTDQLTPGSIAGESTPSNGEATLIADLQSWTQDEVDLYHFAAGDTMFPFMPAGAISSISFAPGASFKAIAFSGGQIIGTGTSVASPTPEPATWALWLLGLGAVGGMMRRRKAAVAG